ncbi:MAG: hypothetical protein LIP23_02430, partial [Planctomycetes bacterium]|nr:hypothetical protein [Planctomycetota bacterium]
YPIQFNPSDSGTVRPRKDTDYQAIPPAYFSIPVAGLPPENPVPRTANRKVRPNLYHNDKDTVVHARQY